MMRSREAALVSPYFGSELDALKPICSDDMSDSGNFDAVAELLVHVRSGPEDRNRGAFLSVRVCGCTAISWGAR